MDMLTPISSNAAPAMAVSPVTPATNTGDRGDAQTGNGAGTSGGQGEPGARSAPTTLKYKFDWLLQRQVNAGTLSADKAAAMIRLFTAAVGGDDTTPAAERAPIADPAPADPTTDTNDRAPDDPQKETAAAQLVVELREQFTVDGPYDATGIPHAASPTGIVMNETA